jgi:serine/threonine protein kinase
MTSPAQQTCPSCSTPAEDGAVVCAKCGTLLTDTIDSPEAAELLGELGRALDGRYVIGEPLGAGRGGITVRAHHTGSKREVAVKVAWKDPAARTQVLRETILTAKVTHPAALAVRDIQAPESMLVVEMPLAYGGTLADPIANGKPMPYPRVLEIVRAVAGALDQAHAAGIIHGGLRPVKILIDEQGNPLVSDFEIRLPRRADWDVTRASEVGAQAYMPLEQRHDSPSIDGRVDQYALAIIAYELLRGQATWRINDEGVLEIDAIDIMVHRPVAPEAPLSASMAIKRATAKDPAFRYASAGAFARAFSGEAVDVHAGAQIHRDAFVTQQRRSKAWLAIPAVLAIAVVAVQPNARESVAELWKGSWPFGDGLKIPGANPIVPAQGGNTIIGRTNEQTKQPGQPTNTRVGDTSRTVAAGQPPRPADASPREQQQQTPRELNKGGTASRPGTSPATIASGPANASGSTKDTTPRRAAVGGEITPRSNNASATPPSAAAPKGDGVVIITVDANERAAVFIDGRPRGQTPLTLKISAGKHTVAVRSGTTSFLPSSLSIDVAPGDTTRATFGLGRP